MVEGADAGGLVLNEASINVPTDEIIFQDGRCLPAPVLLPILNFTANQNLVPGKSYNLYPMRKYQLTTLVPYRADNISSPSPTKSICCRSYRHRCRKSSSHLGLVLARDSADKESLGCIDYSFEIEEAQYEKFKEAYDSGERGETPASLLKNTLDTVKQQVIVWKHL